MRWSELVAGHSSGWSKRARGPKSSPRWRQSQRSQRAAPPSSRLGIGESRRSHSAGPCAGGAALRAALAVLGGAA
eukprot:13678315-Alexandrium_andersonii.AAC.1